MTCTPQALVSAAICYTKLGKNDLEAADIYLLCRWATSGPHGCTHQGLAWMYTPFLTFAANTIGISTAFNPFVPPPFNPTYAILAWGTTSGVYTNQLIVPFANYNDPFALLPPPPINNFILNIPYYFVVRQFDDAEHCSDLSDEIAHVFAAPAASTPIWAPATEQVTWIDTNGTFVGDLATFEANVSAATLTSMVFGPTGNLTSLTNLGTAPNLVTLDVNTNALTALDCTGLAALTTLDCSLNAGLTTLTLTGCTALVTIDCDTSPITSLDVHNFTSLTDLLCYNCALTTLNVSGCTALSNFQASVNSLTTIDISTCAALVTCNIDHNALTSINGTAGLTNVQNMDLSFNALTALNVTGCTGLNGLFLDPNQLTTLDISTCVLLNYLDCRLNNLTVLAVNTILTDLVTNGVQGGTVALENQTPAAAPTVGPPDGIAAVATLTGYGSPWTVTTD